jgi:uncharacterized membrane protein YbhN (UPF0104 family)
MTQRAATVGAALHAFGAHLSLAALLIAVTVAGVLASASSAGGGMGVAEAGLILALTAGGIAKNDATAAVFIQLAFSAYLPPIAGWFTLMWMRKREYLWLSALGGGSRHDRVKFDVYGS